MMHGYMVFDKEGHLLVPFRTWRNTITGEAAEKLTEIFGYPIPQRWSIAHLYQAILNKEPHVKNIDYMITLEGYVHWKLTGRKVLGIGDVAGMFPVDPEKKDFDRNRIRMFDELVAEEKLPWKLEEILPEALTAGEDAGLLTEEGAALLDVSGNLKSGIPCVRRKVTQAPAWQPPTACGCALEMCLQEPAFLPWWCWRSH